MNIKDWRRLRWLGSFDKTKMRDGLPLAIFHQKIAFVYLVLNFWFPTLLQFYDPILFTFQTLQRSCFLITNITEFIWVMNQICITRNPRQRLRRLLCTCDYRIYLSDESNMYYIFTWKIGKAFLILSSDPSTAKARNRTAEQKQNS